MHAQTTRLKLDYPPDVEAYVSRQLASGRFQSESDLATSAIQIARELEAREQRFREDLNRSIDQADGGDLLPLDTDATLREARRRIPNRE